MLSTLKGYASSSAASWTTWFSPTSCRWRVVAGDRQEAPHDPHTALGRRRDLLRALDERPAPGGSAQQLDLAPHDRKRIIELVGDAGQQRAHRGQLLGVSQRLFRLPTFRDVAHDA